MKLKPVSSKNGNCKNQNRLNSLLMPGRELFLKIKERFKNIYGG
jgi:hypothetical protein